LHSLRSETPHLVAIVEGRGRYRLARVAPLTSRTTRTSAWKIGAPWGWVISPGGRSVAVAACRHKCSSFALRFGSVATLHWEPGTVPLDAGFYAGLWPRPDRLYALVGGDTTLALDTVDPRTRRIVAREPLAGQLMQIARSADTLVVLAGTFNTIAPARLLVVDSDGTVRSLTVPRILAGTHYDTKSQDLIGTTNLPGLAVDPTSGTAYLIDPSGLVASVDLANLSVAYHQLGSDSLLTRIAGWLTPPAEAKGTNGSTLSAQWLGKGLIAVAGTQGTVTAQVDSYRPSGLRIVDTRNWSVRMLDQRADSFMIADGLLVTTGTRSSYGDSARVHGEGLAAYGPRGSLRWRLKGLGQQIYLVWAYRSLALVDAKGTPRLIDLESGRVMRESSPPGLLLGPGSPTAPGSY